MARLGPASAVIVRDGRMYEVPPPPAVHEEDPRVRQRRVAATLGEALEVQPYTWQGGVAPDDRIALVSRHFAHTVGVDELKRALAGQRPVQAVEYLQHLFTVRGGTGSDGLLAIEITELAATATTHQLEPVRPAEPFAGLPDQSPVPLADAIGRGMHRAGDAAEGAKGAPGARASSPCCPGSSPSFRTAAPNTRGRSRAPRSGRRDAGAGSGSSAWPGWPCSWRSDRPLRPCRPRARRTPSRAPRSRARRSPMRPGCSSRSRSASTARISSTATRSWQRSCWPMRTPPSSGPPRPAWPMATSQPLRQQGRRPARRAVPGHPGPGARRGGRPGGGPRGRRPGRHGGCERRIPLDPRDRSRTGHPPGSRRRKHRGRLPRGPGPRLGRGARRPVAHRHRGDRRRRHRSRPHGVAHRPRRAHPAADGAERR